MAAGSSSVVVRFYDRVYGPAMVSAWKAGRVVACPAGLDAEEWTLAARRVAGLFGIKVRTFKRANVAYAGPAEMTGTARTTTV